MLRETRTLTGRGYPISEGHKPRRSQEQQLPGVDPQIHNKENTNKLKQVGIKRIRAEEV